MHRRTFSKNMYKLSYFVRSEKLQRGTRKRGTGWGPFGQCTKCTAVKNAPVRSVVASVSGQEERSRRPGPTPSTRGLSVSGHEERSRRSGSTPASRGLSVSGHEERSRRSGPTPATRGLSVGGHEERSRRSGPTSATRGLSVGRRYRSVTNAFNNLHN